MGNPISEKKLDKGEGLWQFRKEILGWLFDGASRCIELPQDKRDKIDKILKDMLRKGRLGKILFKDFEKIVGKLRHASIGIPAGRGLFQALNMKLNERPRYVWLRPRSAIRSSLK